MAAIIRSRPPGEEPAVRAMLDDEMSWSVLSTDLTDELVKTVESMLSAATNLLELSVADGELVAATASEVAARLGWEVESVDDSEGESEVH